MKTSYMLGLVDRGECLEYRDAADIYRFGVVFRDNQWIVKLPATKGDYYEPHELTDSERAVILPRLRSFLECKKDFVLFGKSHPVAFEVEEVVSSELRERRRRASEFFKSKSSS